MPIKLPKGTPKKVTPPTATAAVAAIPSKQPGVAFLTVKQVAQRWIVSEKYVRQQIANDDLAVTRFGRAIRISMKDVAVFEARNS